MTDRGARASAILSALTVTILAVNDELSGQHAADFDDDRLYLVDEDTYLPFVVQETVPLRQALDDDRLDGETSLLVMDHPEAGRLALVTDQMAYHHVAQGELAGEPWMVSF